MNRKLQLILQICRNKEIENTIKKWYDHSEIAILPFWEKI